MKHLGLLLLALAGCAGDPDAVLVELSPSLISSLDGTTTVSALVAAETTPLPDEVLRISVTYTDRNGTPHDVPAVDGRTDERGIFAATLTGLTWDGIGTVTVEAANGTTGTATFSVLDRTPPVVTILPPTTDLRVGAGLPLDVQVQVTDEIGVSEVILDGQGAIDGDRRTLVASGSQDTTINFRVFVPPSAQAGPNITLYALASDLSGNIAVAEPVTLTVDPTIAIATPAGLSGALLADGTTQQLVNPRAITVSSKDGKLYVADAAATGACNPSCVWKIDATTGAIDPTPVHVGQGTLEGVAVDATSDNLYITDRQNRIVRLTWNGTAYAGAASCIDPAQQQPQDPYHLAIDATLGILAVDGQDKNLQTVATCATSSQGAALSQQDSFDEPRGMAIGATGDLFVSDIANDLVSRVNRTNGNVTGYAQVDQPYGMEWLAGGPSSFADSLLVASQGDRTITAVTSTGQRAASYLRNTPIDVAVASGTMFILTVPSANNRGRVFKVGGL